MEWSTGVFQPLERRGHDGGEAGRRRQALELGRAHPARFGEFVVERMTKRLPDAVNDSYKVLLQKLRDVAQSFEGHC